MAKRIDIELVVRLLVLSLVCSLVCNACIATYFYNEGRKSYHDDIVKEQEIKGDAPVLIYPNEPETIN